MGLTKAWLLELEQQKQALEDQPFDERVQLAVAEKLSERARLGADARHAETRAMKADAFKWLDANMSKFKSMDAAAQAMVKEQPIVFRTARAWATEWKKLRSASKP